MSLDKAIKSGKEHRKPYRIPKSVDGTCCNHGSCPYCKGNRLYQRTKEEQKAKNKIEEMTK